MTVSGFFSRVCVARLVWKMGGGARGTGVGLGVVTPSSESLPLVEKREFDDGDNFVSGR